MVPYDQARVASTGLANPARFDCLLDRTPTTHMRVLQALPEALSILLLLAAHGSRPW